MALRFFPHRFDDYALRLGSAPSPPPPQAPPPAPLPTDPSVLAAQQAQATAAAEAAGRGSTILTSGLGDTQAVSTAKKALLGG